jgi:hypothetical protein
MPPMPTQADLEAWTGLSNTEHSFYADTKCQLWLVKEKAA